MEKKKQIHVEIPIELHISLTNICTENGQISILTRKLYRAFLKYKDIDAAGKNVAKHWEED